MSYRYFLLDLRARDFATCANSLEEIDRFPFYPEEWAIVDTEVGTMWNDFETWQGVPSWVSDLLWR